MSETLNTPQTPYRHIQYIFGLAYEAANDLLDVEPIPLDNKSFQPLQAQARDRLSSFVQEATSQRHNMHPRTAIGNIPGLHLVHPDANISGSLYHASRPGLLTFDLVTLQGIDSHGEPFDAEELIIRDNPDYYTARDTCVRRMTFKGRGLQPIPPIAHPSAVIKAATARLSEFSATPDTADTTRQLIVSAPDA